MGDVAGWAGIVADWTGSMLSWPVSAGSKYRRKEEVTMVVKDG